MEPIGTIFPITFSRSKKKEEKVKIIAGNVGNFSKHKSWTQICRWKQGLFTTKEEALYCELRGKKPDGMVGTRQGEDEETLSGPYDARGFGRREPRKHLE